MPTPDSISRETDLSGMEYKWGFTTDVETELAPKGIDESIVELISKKKNEPQWMLDWRMRAYKHWEKINKNHKEPTWAKVNYPPIDYQDIYYYAAPKSMTETPKSLDDVDPEMLETFEKRPKTLYLDTFKLNPASSIQIDQKHSQTRVFATST